MCRDETLVEASREVFSLGGSMIFLRINAATVAQCVASFGLALAPHFVSAAPHPTKTVVLTDALMVDVKLSVAGTTPSVFDGRVVLPLGKSEWSVVEESKGRRLLVRAKLIEANVAEVETRLETIPGKGITPPPAEAYTILVELGQAGSMVQTTEGFGGAKSDLKVHAVKIRYTL